VDLLVAFAREQTAARWPGLSYWHVGDIVWRIFQNTVFDPVANIRVWSSGERVDGVGWFEPPDQVEFDVRAAEAGLVTEILAWAEERARLLRAHDGAALLTTTALDADAERIAMVETRGYAKLERHNVRMRRSLDAAIPDVPMANGMRIRHATNDHVEERVDLHRDAWSVWGTSSVTAEAYRRLRGAPGYDEQLDIVVEAADGRLVSYCVCWIDAANGVGEFEPVGTRPEFAGQGLARAVIFEGLRRMRERGMHTALVQTASINERALALYPSCGFEVVERELSYTKRLV
jgi:ribosomal protein S18 acetylase RimI-like enzyme